MSDKTKTFHIPTFNGKEEEFAVFWPRFQAYGTLKKFSKVLLRIWLRNDLEGDRLVPSSQKSILLSIYLNDEVFWDECRQSYGRSSNWPNC